MCLFACFCTIINLKDHQLASARLTFLKENNYPQWYRDLIDAKATSDDELAPSGLAVKGPKEYHIKKQPECSVEFEMWIRLLDEKREEDACRDPSRRWCEHLQIVPDDQKNSEFLILPTGMPVDYFDPLFFNSLQPRL